MAEDETLVKIIDQVSQNFCFWSAINATNGDTHIVICVSPLVALMADQKQKFSAMGITADFIARNTR